MDNEAIKKMFYLNKKSEPNSGPKIVWGMPSHLKIVQNFAFATGEGSSATLRLSTKI
jgi:hypothetical protein